jgi:glutamate formiminotransferase
MSGKLVECVPNFSEGRVSSAVDAIVRAMLAVPEVALLDRQSDADHNRSVITLAGPPAAVADAAFRGVEKAVELIDLTRHQGAHPRIGAADVVPFIPLEGVTMEECVRLAEGVGQRIWSRLKVPVYLYEAAAKLPGRANLENVRRGQFEALVREMGTLAERNPDIGDPVCHPTAGATAVGARKFLIAYNINLGTPDLAVAKSIARTIRTSSGGFPGVKSMGMMLASRNLAQVSINLTDFERTPLHVVFEAVKREAGRYGVEVAGSEIVGLVPRKALEMAAGHFLRCENFRPESVLENRIAAAISQRAGLPSFLDALAAPAASPGGCRAAVAAAAMAAALGSRMARLAGLDGCPFEEDRRFFAVAVESGTAAPHLAATVPLEVLERCAELERRLDDLRIPAAMAGDLAVAKSLTAAAKAGLLDFHGSVA